MGQHRVQRLILAGPSPHGVFFDNFFCKIYVIIDISKLAYYNRGVSPTIESIVTGADLRIGKGNAVKIRSSTHYCYSDKERFDLKGSVTGLGWEDAVLRKMRSQETCLSTTQSMESLGWEMGGFFAPFFSVTSGQSR